MLAKKRLNEPRRNPRESRRLLQYLGRRETFGVSPTKVRKVPQDFCQLPGRKGFSAIPELPRRDLVSRSVLGA
jgi:hypothetical protein